jgi:hypothetical protein
MPRKNDVFSENLFEPESVEPPELLNRVTTPDGEHKVLDDRGNEYTERGQIKKEKPTNALQRALDRVRSMRPGETVESSDEQVQFYRRKFEREKREADNQ